MPPPHTTHLVGTVVPSDRTAWPLCTSLTPTPRWMSTPLLAQHLGDVAVRFVGERLQQGVAEVKEIDVSLARVERVVLSRDRDPNHVGDRAGHLDTRRTSTDDHEIERAASRSATDRHRPPRAIRESENAAGWRRRASTAETHAPARRVCRRSWPASRRRGRARPPSTPLRQSTGPSSSRCRPTRSRRA